MGIFVLSSGQCKNVGENTCKEKYFKD